jgi:predicted nucleic acid-binding protein
MKRAKTVILDTGPVISLSVIDQLDLLTHLFDKIFIANAVWEELNRSEFFQAFPKIKTFFENRVKRINRFNELILITDYGESESMLLYKELIADFLVIDDKKARSFAEELEINCIGTLAVLIKAKEKGLIADLKPIFKNLIQNKRFYSKSVLNEILSRQNESTFDQV